jgi:hypothetical protein
MKIRTIKLGIKKIGIKNNWLWAPVLRVVLYFYEKAPIPGLKNKLQIS